MPIDLRFPPKETVRLTLPPAGSVVVRVQDEQGRTIQEGILVDLSVRAGAPRPTPQEGRSVLPPTRAIQAHVSQETTRFPHVALGSELSVMARSPRGARYPGVGQDLPGPTRAGEELELTLRFFFSASQLTGLVLVDAGARLENTLLKLVFTSTHNQVRQSVREGPRDREPWSRFRESG